MLIAATIPFWGEPEKPMSECARSWRSCADNAELANDWRGYFKVRSECQSAATKLARFGTPEFPWSAFHTFRTGKDAPTTGRIVAVEPEAKFSNGFGAMVHTRVTCLYDLNQAAVVDVTLE